MNTTRLDAIKVVLGEADAETRQSLVQSLRAQGVRDIKDVGTLAELARAVNAGNIDLLIVDQALPGGDVDVCLSELRHDKHGDNPFLVAISLIETPRADQVHGAIDAGTDHVLVKPLDPDALIQDVINLTFARKPFVVTSAYIGPERRSRARPGMQIPQIEVPNSLRHRMTGQLDDDSLRRAIETTKAVVNQQKVERQAYQIGWLLDRLLPQLRENGQSQDFNAEVEHLASVSFDLSERIKSTQYAHVSGMCMTLYNMVKGRVTCGFTTHDIQLLGKAAELIKTAFDPALMCFGAPRKSEPWVDQEQEPPRVAIVPSHRADAVA